MAGKAALSAYLTRATWLLAFALSFAQQHISAAVEPFDSLGEELRCAVQYLAENGLQLAALGLTTDGRLVPVEPEPICEENLPTSTAPAYGAVHEHPALLCAAIAFGETAISHRPHDLDMLRQTLTEVGEARSKRLKADAAKFMPLSSARRSLYVSGRVLPMREKLLISKDPGEERVGALFLRETAHKPQTPEIVLALGLVGYFDGNDEAGEPIFPPTGYRKGGRVIFGECAGCEVRVDGETPFLLTSAEVHAKTVSAEAESDLPVGATPWFLAEHLAESAAAGADQAVPRSSAVRSTAAGTLSGPETWTVLVKGYAQASLGRALQEAGQSEAAQEALEEAERLWAQGEDAGVFLMEKRFRKAIRAPTPEGTRPIRSNPRRT